MTAQLPSRERLEALASGNAFTCVQDDEATAMARALLAAHEQEPVAWLLSGGGAKNAVSFDSGNAYVDPLREVTPLYTHPAPVPVVPDDVINAAYENHLYGIMSGTGNKRAAIDFLNECLAAIVKTAKGDL